MLQTMPVALLPSCQERQAHLFPGECISATSVKPILRPAVMGKYLIESKSHTLGSAVWIFEYLKQIPNFESTLTNIFEDQVIN